MRPARGGVGEEDADLAVLDPPGRPRVLALATPARLHSLLQEAGLINDQHRLRVAEVFDDVRPQVIAHLVGAPLGAPEQVLQAVGRRVAGLFGQLPAVLALDR